MFEDTNQNTEIAVPVSNNLHAKNLSTLIGWRYVVYMLCATQFIASFETIFIIIHKVQF